MSRSWIRRFSELAVRLLNTTVGLAGTVSGIESVTTILVNEFEPEGIVASLEKLFVEKAFQLPPAPILYAEIREETGEDVT